MKTNYKRLRIYNLTDLENMETNDESKHENACLKRCVLGSVLKQLRSFIALIFDRNLFQSLGADAINDLSPKVLLVMVLGGNNCSSD